LVGLLILQQLGDLEVVLSYLDDLLVVDHLDALVVGLYLLVAFLLVAFLPVAFLLVGLLDDLVVVL
jgi:hypothetical protein